MRRLTLALLIVLFTSPWIVPDLYAQAAGATLSWTAPTTNTDGTTLDDLAGYRVYYGRQTGAFDVSITLNDPTLTSFFVSQLSNGPWFFAVTAFNTAGDESAFSNEATKTITDGGPPRPKAPILTVQ